VRDIVALASPRGVDVVVDAAHSFGQVPLTVTELDAEFVGFNLHKWVGAPLGVGAMYIREDKIGSVDPAQGPEALPGALIDARLHTGTVNLATIMTVPDHGLPGLDRDRKTRPPVCATCATAGSAWYAASTAWMSSPPDGRTSGRSDHELPPAWPRRRRQ